MNWLFVREDRVEVTVPIDHMTLALPTIDVNER